MAKKAPVLTPAEIKAAKKDLALALKNVKENLKPYQAAANDAKKVLAQAKKDADKAVAAAQKAFDAAEAKLGKAFDAASKGEAKIQEKLAALEPTPAALP